MTSTLNELGDPQVRHVPQWTQNLDSIPTLPIVAGRLIEMALSDTTSTNELGEVLSRDPGLTAKLLKVVNSTSYGMRSEVSSVSHAVSIIGRQALRSLVLGISVFETFKDPSDKNNVGAGHREALWKHAVATAAAAQIIAEAVGKVNAEEAYIAGLMHDIGKVALELLRPAEYRKALTDLTAPRAEDERVYEEKHCGLDHTAVGDLLAERWSLPTGIRAAIHYHHSVEGAAALPTPIRRIVAIVKAADVVAYRCGYPSTDAVRPPEVDKITEELLSRLQQDSVLQCVKEEVKKSAEVFRYGESTDPESWQKKLYAANGELSKAFASLGETNRLQQRCMDFIVQTHRLLGSKEPVEAVLRDLVAKFGFDKACFLELSDDGRRVVPRAIETADGRGSTAVGRPIDLGAVNTLPLDQSTFVHLTNGKAQDPLLRALAVPCLVVSPILEDGRVRYFLATDRGTKTVAAHEAAALDLTVHKLFAPGFSLFLINDKLYKRAQFLSVTDVLTGVSNRRALMEFIEATEAEARRSKEPYCAVMLDIDHFKKFNDECGHQAGDLVLRSVAQAIRTHCRGDDCVGRYGGEEFCLVMPKTAISDGLDVAERVRAAVEAEGKTVRAQYGGKVVTISAGIASLTNLEEEHESLLSRADAALYKAKQAGRNRVEAAEPGESAG